MRANTKRHIPQHEFSFAAENFNLAGEATADGARIQRETEQAKADRAESEARQTGIETLADVLKRTGDGSQPYPNGGLQVFVKESTRRDYFRLSDAYVAASLSGPSLLLVKNPATIPGLAPGSRWSVPDSGMRKALATMQG